MALHFSVSFFHGKIPKIIRTENSVAFICLTRQALFFFTKCMCFAKINILICPVSPDATINFLNY